ncbi:hypothetical protein C1637_24735 [Chryseobacterium lactis]|uniref:Uncharacterized protein n=1 Tax=Chryseobacterium lactis TaxID=1241981 RepID=A0A3G6RYD6_CHRLC|nr:hypothetical protein [Chryseobacterium lactis]AZA81936.1 hypothetical protein EG342_08455 [Chryseobacterium lactis]AZB06934.1 hypothetical protein EG341_24570 [Chryseobacterium lactis]PNW10984.1 hypothetical protein C1637_24735 [Chryseobacterium lactis]
MTSPVSDIFPTSTYAVQDKCTVKIGKEQHEAQLSYTLYVEPGKKGSDEILINRTNLKVNNQKIDTRFLEISNAYMEALFPLTCKINTYSLSIENMEEIRKRIQQVDVEIHDIYNGDGIDHIQNQFFTATQTDEKLSQFIQQLHFMRMLDYSLQKFNPKRKYGTMWKVLPFGMSEWKGETQYQKDKNTLSFEPKIDNAQDIMNDIIRYIHKHDYYVKFDEETLPLYADFQNKITYTGKTGRIENAETNVCIEAEDKFYYQQTITIETK